jgi:hypothetical protein
MDARDSSGSRREPNTFRRYMHMAFKKMLLVASMALAAIAFSVPASASALDWTHEGGPFSGTRSDGLTGKLSFGNPALGQNKFGCIVHISLTANGGSTTGSITSFDHTTSTCTGEGSFAGCEVVDDQTTGLPEVVHTTATNSLTVTGPIIFHTVFDDNCPIVKSTLTVSEFSMGINSSNLTDVVIAGLAETHTMFRVTGLEVTQTTAVFGTLKTATETLSIE